MKVRNDLPRRGRYRGVHQRSTHSDLAWIRRSRDSAPKRPQPSRFQGHKRSQNIGATEARRWVCCRCSVQCRLQRNRSVTDLCNIQEPRHRQSGLSVVVSSPALRLVRVLGFPFGIGKCMDETKQPNQIYSWCVVRRGWGWTRRTFPFR